MANAQAKPLGDGILNAVKGTPLTIPAILYVGLFTTLPTKNDGTGAVEVTGGGYTRQPITSAQWSAISTNADNLHEQVSNSVPLLWNQASANWGTILGAGLYDAATNGNLWLSGLQTPSETINTGQQYSLPAGTLTWEA